MKRSVFSLCLVVALSACSGGASVAPHASGGPQAAGSARSTQSAGTCLTVVTSTKGALTAALVPSAGAMVAGTVDAHGCNIGVYVGSGAPGVQIAAATVTDANDYGIFDDAAANLTVTSSTVQNTGNHAGGVYAPNGVQTGIAYYQTGGSAVLHGNTLTAYQKNGTAVRNGGSVAMTGNVVTGAGPVAYIAQNGIEVIGSAITAFSNNTVSGNFYTGSKYFATGYLLLGTGVSKDDVIAQGNTSINNQHDYYINESLK